MRGYGHNKGLNVPALYTPDVITQVWRDILTETSYKISISYLLGTLNNDNCSECLRENWAKRGL